MVTYAICPALYFTSLHARLNHTTLPPINADPKQNMKVIHANINKLHLDTFVKWSKISNWLLLNGIFVSYNMGVAHLRWTSMLKLVHHDSEIDIIQLLK